MNYRPQNIGLQIIISLFTFVFTLIKKIMKKIFIIMLCLPLVTMGQKTKGYGFIGAGMHFIEKTENIGGRLNFGFLPSPNAGIGADVQYIRDYGVPVLADLRFISNHIKGSRLTIAFKAGTTMYDKSGIKGGFTYGAETGLIFGKANQGFYISAQYLSIKYQTKTVFIKQDDIAVGIGVKF